jgi:signal transduction histidine kinase
MTELMTEPTPATAPTWPHLEHPDEWPLVARIVPYILLAGLAVFTAVMDHFTGRALLIDLVLCAVCAAWMLEMVTLHPAWRHRRAVMAVFLAGFDVIWLVLVLRDPWFGCFAPAAYIYAFQVLPFPAELPGVAAVAAVAATAQGSTIHKDNLAGVLEYVALLIINVVPMCGLSWFGSRITRFNIEREHALEQVREANHRLEATLAENAGLHDQLVTQAREAGILDERARMAREIHDTLAQGLTGIVTQLQAAEQAAADPQRWRRHFASATRLARDSLAEARRSVDALRPQPLESARLSDALADVAERWSALQGIPVQVATTGTVRPLRPDAELALLRTAQEALANVAKHAQAGRVGLTLSYLEHEVALDVRDDGKGFDVQHIGADNACEQGAEAALVAAASTAARGGPNPGMPGPRRLDSGGFGLVAMRQRIEGVCGTLQVESEPGGGGTAVSARVPLVATEAHS